MSDETPSAKRETPRPAHDRRKNRRRTAWARARGSMWGGVHGILGADFLWSGTLVVLVVLTLGGQRCGHDYEQFEVGQQAASDIKAVKDFEFVDALRTDEARAEAVDQVLEIYEYHTGRSVQLARQLAEFFAQGRQLLQDADPGAPETAEAVVARELGDRLSTEALNALLASRFDLALERDMTSVLTATMARKVVANKAILAREGRITLRTVPGDHSETIEEFEDFIELERARETVRLKIAERLGLSRSEEQALGTLAASFVDANVSLDSMATDQQRQDARHAVRSVIQRFRQGDVLARAGEPLTQDIIDRLEVAGGKLTAPLGLHGFLGLLFLAAMFAFFVFRYTRFHQRRFRKIKNLHALIVLMVTSMLALSRAILWLAGEIVDNLSYPFNQLDSYGYLIPLGAGAILVTLLANGRIATVYSAFAAFLFGAANDWNAYQMVWAMLVQCAGVYAISAYRERAALLRAGLVVGGAGAVTAMALEALKDPPEPLSYALYGAGLAFIGGAIGVGLLISFALPILERLFNVLTDIRLLELSNVNNPLLTELAMRAPGSYNHSLVVGTLAEEAARAIGANSLFCRVAAFYHDIGKINKAEYFVENQRGVNPHDRLSPSMSALIIASHVKDGIKMAREAGLPEQIVDIIPQHHGTKLMTYFYEKARANTDPSLGPVKEEDFRYPGPKPQTREAAIFMLADAAEAAARTIDEPTSNRLRDMIRRITNSIVLDGELDSCDMTFVDLERIQQSFLRTLVSMYHHRVDYPGFDFTHPKGEGEPPRGATRANGKAAEIADRKVARGS